MKISLNEIKKLVKIPEDISTSDLVQLIGSRLVEVEEKIPLSPKYEKSTIVKVVECEPIPETHLHLCQIDTGGIGVPAGLGGGSAEPERQRPVTTGALDASRKNANSSCVQVVCGAPNVHKGMLAVWLQPGAIVPQTYGNEDFKLDVRKLRGYESHGMLAGLDELDLGDDHSGIVEIDPDMQFNGRSVQPGDSFAEVFDLNDIILDIENKSLTHRPDTFGLIGFAREVAGVLGIKFNEPDFIFHESVFPEDFLAYNDHNGVTSKNCPLTVELKDAKICPRYSCAVIELDDATTDSKYLTHSDVFLAKAGMHGISKIVDITNVIMLMTGQPLHAFDYDKFLKVAGGKAKIGVCTAKDGEELQLLDGKTIKCISSDILITANNKPVALAGAMGGASTMIDASTKRVLLESASFSLYNLRKTQMHHGIFSEAITRFTKGVPPADTFNVLAEAVKQLGGKPVAVYDNFAGWQKTEPISVTLDEINSLLGTNYDKKTVIKTLANVGIKEIKDFSFQPPLWRTDLHIKEDIIEEVGRLLGYDNIPQTLPLRHFIGTEPDPIIELKTKLRNILSDQLAAHEILTYSFVNKALQTTVGENPADSYEIANSISPDLQCFRQSLIPSILDKTYDNLKAGYKDFALYELNQVTNKSLGLTFENVPLMQNHLALVTIGDFYQAKALLLAFAKNLHLELKLQPFKSGAKYFEPAHSAEVYLGNAKLGAIGEIKKSVLKQLKISDPIAAFELDIDVILTTPPTPAKQLELSKFPSVERDLTVRVKSDQPFAEIEQTITKSLEKSQLTFSATPVSVYQSEKSHKNLSFHLEFAHLQKTLSGEEISDIMNNITKNLQKLGADVI
ncbi:phenylalanine--tRNA ligase subunit beta [Candidatus Saccharibacteria bacterium]|nr:phenylalanine--tRNA ligase subunit beta [Candidatus Saccharibacteria bacterium]